LRKGGEFCMRGKLRSDEKMKFLECENVRNEKCAGEFSGKKFIFLFF
jgi:hypothetical protein